MINPFDYLPVLGKLSTMNRMSMESLLNSTPIASSALPQDKPLTTQFSPEVDNANNRFDYTKNLPDRHQSQRNSDTKATILTTPHSLRNCY